jgi:hypothetical protein
MDFDESQLDTLPDALLVSFYRYLKCCRGTPESTERMVELVEVEIDARGIDLNTFRGDTGFTS